MTDFRKQLQQLSLLLKQLDGTHALLEKLQGLGDHPLTPVLYYEAHITIEPVFGEALERAGVHARNFAFRVADLLMQKRTEDTLERSKFDTFMTSRHASYVVLEQRTKNLVIELQSNGFKVWRYKIETTVVDSKHGDAWEILSGEKA